MGGLATASFLGAGINVVLGLILLLSKGRAANLVAGYNTMAPAKKARYDPQKVTRYTGIMLLMAAGVLLLSGGIYLVYPREWLIVAGWVIFGIIAVGGAIRANIGEPFLKDEYKAANQD